MRYCPTKSNHCSWRWVIGDPNLTFEPPNPYATISEPRTAALHNVASDVNITPSPPPAPSTGLLGGCPSPSSLAHRILVHHTHQMHHRAQLQKPLSFLSVRLFEVSRHTPVYDPTYLDNHLNHMYGMYGMYGMYWA